MNLIYKTGLMLAVFLIYACSSSNPESRAKAYNYNENQANSIINYTTKHKKQRQKISAHNRKVANEGLIKSNHAINGAPTQQSGEFKIYKNTP